MDGDTKKYIEGGTLGSSDSLTIGETGMTAGMTLMLDQDLSVSSITFAGDKSVGLNSTNKSTKLNVSGDITSGATNGCGLYNMTVSIGGTITTTSPNGVNITSCNSISVGNYYNANGGTIKLRLKSATQVDSLDLTSYYKKGVDTTTGESVVTYTKVDGGTITRGDDSERITFDFGNNLGWLIDYVDDDGKLGVKIISCDAIPQTVDKTDFYAAGFTSSDDCQADFTMYDDGLYVRYVAVPEPAEIAVFFGAIALAIAAYRRRK